MWSMCWEGFNLHAGRAAAEFQNETEEIIKKYVESRCALPTYKWYLIRVTRFYTFGIKCTFFIYQCLSHTKLGGIIINGQPVLKYIARAQATKFTNVRRKTPG